MISILFSACGQEFSVTALSETDPSSCLEEREQKRKQARSGLGGRNRHLAGAGGGPGRGINELSVPSVTSQRTDFQAI